MESGDRPDGKGSGEELWGADGDVAAVNAGLPPRSLSLAEHLVLKATGVKSTRVADYCECRNTLLALWEEDVGRQLLLRDCGVADVAEAEEPPRSALLRQAYHFLNQQVSFWPTPLN